MNITDRTLERFKNDITVIFGSHLYEIIIHGSYALGDFTPNKGDIDYTILTENDLDDSDIDALFALHDSYRKQNNLLLHQLEGTTYPKRVLTDIRLPFIGCYIGTGRKGWRKISTFQNSLIDLKAISEYGKRLLGTTTPLYCPSEAEIQAEQFKDLRSFRDEVQRSHNTEIGFWYSLIHWCARTIYYREKRKIVSKSEACYWCREGLERTEFADLFAAAENRRYPYGDEPVSDDFRKLCIDLLYFTEERVSESPADVIRENRTEQGGCY